MKSDYGVIELVFHAMQWGDRYRRMTSVPHRPLSPISTIGAQLDPQRVIGATFHINRKTLLPTFQPSILHTLYTMSSIINKIKDAASGNKGDSNSSEQSFSIQPHPAKSNNPNELEAVNGQKWGGGLTSERPDIQSGGGFQAHNAHGPQIPSQQLQAGLEEPASREELHARAAELNK
ncbi:hypothetical protein HWV62_15513 [Athelia sp. TMB]|nr:hypothetical protein HWV62_15513 [Athelia sp. TMB]